MAAPLAVCTKEEQRSVFRFNSEGVKPIEIHRQVKVQYGEVYVTTASVRVD